MNSLVDSTVSPYTRNGGRLDEIPRIVTAEMNPVLEPIPNYISGTSSLETIPNYIPGSDPGVTPLIASDRGFLRDLIKFGPGENPDAGYDHSNIAMTPASPGTGEQRMAGTNPNPILRAIVNYVNDLNSGKYNHTQSDGTRKGIFTIPDGNKPYIGDFASQEFNNPLQNLLNPRWNYSNMGNAIQSERDSAVRIP